MKYDAVAAIRQFQVLPPSREGARRMVAQVLAAEADLEALLAFFDFPAEHWDHLRTSNPIESVFATVRHRTVRTKGALSAKTAKLMVFKLVNAAAKTWRRLKGEN
jgi:transposase-like protein